MDETKRQELRLNAHAALRVADAEGWSEADVTRNLARLALEAADELKGWANSRDTLAEVMALAIEHTGTWREEPESYWLAQLHEEMSELTLVLHGKQEGPLEWELRQIAAICINWLDMRREANRLPF
jgi:hypothetical protein